MNTELRKLPLFEALSDEELNWLAEHAKEVSLDEGEHVFPDYAPTDAFWVLIEGEWTVTRRVAGKEETMFTAARPGTWTGGIPVVDAIAPVRAQVLRPSRLLCVPIDAMHYLLTKNFALSQRLLEGLGWGANHIGTLIGQHQIVDATDG